MGMRYGVAVCAPVMGVHKCVLMNMNMVSDDGIDDDKAVPASMTDRASRYNPVSFSFRIINDRKAPIKGAIA